MQKTRPLYDKQLAFLLLTIEFLRSSIYSEIPETMPVENKTPEPPSPRGQLMRQIQFLQNSIEAFDRGQLDEAIRIATAARVIIHQTRNSTSLLRQLSAETIPLYTTCRGPLENSNGPNPWDGRRAFRYDGAGLFRQSPAGTYYGPKLGQGS